MHIQSINAYLISASYHENRPGLRAVSANLVDFLDSYQRNQERELTSSEFKNFVYLANLLKLSTIRHDSLINESWTYEAIKKVVQSGFYSDYYEPLSEIELRFELGSHYVDRSLFYVDDLEQLAEIPECSQADLFLINARGTDKSSKSEKHSATRVAESKHVLELADVKEQKPTQDTSSKHKLTIDEIYSTVRDSEYWIDSVSLDRPTFALPDFNHPYAEFQSSGEALCLYPEARKPTVQSQISALTDPSRFSDTEVLNLFPPIRLYTRSPYMYKEYPGLEFDSDLGVIFKIKGFTKKQIRQNIIQYPHIVGMDRWGKSKGHEILVPFWKHIEVDGTLMTTSAYWESCADTKSLPKTESFMTEYVIRKYLLERDVKGIDHKYKMRGSLDPFLTLYAPPSYYSDKGYDPVEVGRRCIESRRNYKQTRNPVLRAQETNQYA